MPIQYPNKTRFSLKNITIKPTHLCVHQCPYCLSRQILLRESSDASLSVSEWTRVFSEADELGVNYLDISGGEPTLYGGLLGLIWEAKKLGWYVSINSTGYKIPDVTKELLEVCLDQVILSFLSLDQSLHDRIRGKSGSWRMAKSAMEHLHGFPIRVVVHLIINRYNFRELPELIDFAFSEGVNSLALVYPENDKQQRHLLMSDQEIRFFREEILPECLRRYERHRPQRDSSHRNLAGLYAVHNSQADFSCGIYWPDIKTATQACNRAEMFALIYPNGNVYPCNGVEYVHIPAMGNVSRQSLGDIWYGDRYRQFREAKSDFCIQCPMERHTGIAIASTDNPPYMGPVVKKRPAQLSATRPNDKIIQEINKC